MEPTKIKFDPAKIAMPATADVCEKKFNDLLVICLNIAAYEFGPSLIRAVEIPGFNVAGLPIYPAYLNLSSDLITIGAAVDQPRAEQQIQKMAVPMISTYLALLEEDLASIPDPASLFVHDGPPDDQGLNEEQVESILAQNLTRSRAYVAKIQQQSEQAFMRAITPVEKPRNAKLVMKVPEGIGVALDEYFVDTLLPRFFNKREEGVREGDVLNAVKGGIRWWLRIGNADADFQNNDIVGSADIDVGGAIFACVRKFWDCRWNWECAEISLGLNGRPSVSLMTSNTNQGIAIRAQIVGKPSFTNNLPFPFNAVVNKFGDLVVDAIVAIINIILSLVVIVVIAVEIKIPDMKTKLKLSGFNRFMFQRDAAQPVALPPNKRKFLGVKANVEPQG